MLLQLNPPIPLSCPKGKGLAHLVRDPGPESHLEWTLIVNEGQHAGEVWTFANPHVRGLPNETLGRTIDYSAEIRRERDQFLKVLDPPTRDYPVGARVQYMPTAREATVRRTNTINQRVNVQFDDGEESQVHASDLMPVRS